jgi:hypothetical protein
MAEAAADQALPAFVQHGWEYHATGVPDRGQLRELVHDLLRRLPEDPESFVARGRFRVERDGDGSVSVALELVSDYEFLSDGTRVP